MFAMFIDFCVERFTLKVCSSILEFVELIGFFVSVNIRSFLTKESKPPPLSMFLSCLRELCSQV